MSIKELTGSWMKAAGSSLLKGVAPGSAAKDFRPPWKAKSIWAALVMVLLGGGLYLKDPGSGGMPQPQVKERAAETRPSGEEPVGAGLPATFRLGASYIGGFLIGWGFRRFIRLSLLFSAAALALVTLGRQTGWIDLDWAMLEGQIHHATSWLESEAGAFKAFLESYLPSAGTAGVGAFLGFRRK